MGERLRLEKIAETGIDSALKSLSNAEIAQLLGEMFMRLAGRNEERLVLEAMRRLEPAPSSPARTTAYEAAAKADVAIGRLEDRLGHSTTETREAKDALHLILFPESPNKEGT